MGPSESEWAATAAILSFRAGAPDVDGKDQERGRHDKEKYVQGRSERERMHPSRIHRCRRGDILGRTR